MFRPRAKLYQPRTPAVRDVLQLEGALNPHNFLRDGDLKVPEIVFHSFWTDSYPVSMSKGKWRDAHGMS